MPILLTDDEVAAIAVRAGLRWPTPLPTVAPAADSLQASIHRGIRSLVVRGLDAEGACDEEALVLGAAKADSWITAYVGPGLGPAVVAGTSTFGFRVGDAHWVVDAVAPAGVHSFSTGSEDSAPNLIVALARNVFLYGIRDAENAAALHVGRSDAPTWARVRQGLVEIGDFSDDGGFRVASSSVNWDEDVAELVSHARRTV